MKIFLFQPTLNGNNGNEAVADDSNKTSKKIQLLEIQNQKLQNTVEHYKQIIADTV